MLLVGTSGGLHDLDSGERLLEGRPVTAVAASPAGDWCVLLDHRSVVRLGAASGPAPVGELPEPDGQSLAVLADGTTAVGRAGARLAVIRPTGEVEEVPSFEAVPGRDDWENPASATPDTRTMANGPERWWVNVHVGGLWWSDDAGGAWHQAVDADADVHEVRAYPDGRVAVAAAVGLGWSDDGGSWSWTTEGLQGHYLRAVACDAEDVFVSASDGPFTRRGAVYRGRLGSRLEKCDTGLPEWFDGNVDSSHLDASGDRAAFGFADRVFVSEDRGQTWSEAAALGQRVTTVRLGVEAVRA